jgi:hypothetical protein
MFRPQRGRALKSQCSREGFPRPSGSAPRPHTDHAAWSPPAAYRRAMLARIQPIWVGTRSTCPTANHFPRRRPSPSRLSAGPARACASFEGQAPTSGRRQPCGCRPTPRLRPLSRWTQRTPQRTDAGAGRGGRTVDTWTLRRPHRTPVTWTGPVDHRTLDTGCQTRTRTRWRQHSWYPDLPGHHASDRTLRCPTVRVLSHYQPAARPLRRPSRAPAHCCPQKMVLG